MTLKRSLRELNIPDWRHVMFKIAKGSLQIPVDQRCCENMLGLRDLERYLRDRYVTNVDVVGDLLTPLFQQRQSPSRSKSISLITDTINRMSLLKTRGLWEKVSEFHLCQIIRKCLSPQDQDEFFREEANSTGDDGKE